MCAFVWVTIRENMIGEGVDLSARGRLMVWTDVQCGWLRQVREWDVDIVKESYRYCMSASTLQVRNLYSVRRTSNTFLVR